VTSVGENEEKANIIQPPFLCFSHLQLGSGPNQRDTTKQDSR